MSFLKSFAGRTDTGSQRVEPPMRGSGGAGSKPQARYLRDTASGAISSRRARLTDHRDDVRRSWTRTAALAMDLIQNSGQLKGGCDQIIADTVGVGLTLSPQPNLQSLGWSADQERDWIKTVRQRWSLWQKNARESDFRGKLSHLQQVDIGLRWHIAYGEVTGVFSYFDSATRAAYGIQTGTKLLLVPPHRLVQDTNPLENMVQGVRHDANGRAVSYRFKERQNGSWGKQDYPAFDADGRTQVLHVFDPMDADDVRGISTLAPAIRKHIQAETLDDATLQTAIIQTIFAIVLTSENPSADAFEALQAFEDHANVGQEYQAFLSAKLEQAAESEISIGDDPRVSHLAPGEDLELKTSGMPGQNYLPFRGALAREMARALGLTYGGLTMDHSNATYSSVRMETSSIWPVVMRRRERVAAPISQNTYGNWLDEEIGEGRIPFTGGYDAFRAHREQICAASWQGPPKPTADDFKSAKASTERLKNGTSSIEIETGDLGIDPDTLFDQRRRENDRYLAAGMPSPYAKRGAQEKRDETDQEETTSADAPDKEETEA